MPIEDGSFSLSGGQVAVIAKLVKDADDGAGVSVLLTVPTGSPLFD
jgi:hypothetical protein